MDDETTNLAEHIDPINAAQSEHFPGGDSTEAWEELVLQHVQISSMRAAIRPAVHHDIPLSPGTPDANANLHMISRAGNGREELTEFTPRFPFTRAKSGFTPEWAEIVVKKATDAQPQWPLLQQRMVSRDGHCDESPQVVEHVDGGNVWHLLRENLVAEDSYQPPLFTNHRFREGPSFGPSVPPHAHTNPFILSESSRFGPDSALRQRSDDDMVGKASDLNSPVRMNIQERKENDILTEVASDIRPLHEALPITSIIRLDAPFGSSYQNGLEHDRGEVYTQAVCPSTDAPRSLKLATCVADATDRSLSIGNLGNDRGALAPSICACWCGIGLQELLQRSAPYLRRKNFATARREQSFSS